jgi:hypothetical protein
MRKSLAVFACVLLGVAGLLAVSTLPADARRGGGGARAHAHAGGVGRHAAVHRSFRGNINRGVNRNVVVNRNVNATVNRRYVQRNGRWGYWRNGVWIAAPLMSSFDRRLPAVGRRSRLPGSKRGSRLQPYAIGSSDLGT